MEDFNCHIKENSSEEIDIKDFDFRDMNIKEEPFENGDSTVYESNTNEFDYEGKIKKEEDNTKDTDNLDEYNSHNLDIKYEELDFMKEEITSLEKVFDENLSSTEGIKAENICLDKNYASHLKTFDTILGSREETTQQAYLHTKAKQLNKIVILHSNFSKLTSKNGKLFRCSECIFRTVKKQELIRHIKDHRAGMSFKFLEDNDIATSVLGLESNIKSQITEKPVGLNEVENSLPNRILNEHSREEIDQFDNCEVNTTREAHLQNQIKAKKVKKVLKCDQCCYISYSKYKLDIHMRVHTGEKPFRCEDCDFRTATNSALRTHAKTHTGERPFKCEKCDYSATLKASLQSHSRVHSGEKPFACKQCDFRTSRITILRNHIRIHTGERPFECGHCNYRATTKSSLRKHIKIHMGERSFKCKECDYFATSKAALRSHGKVHSDEKPFTCGQCDYRTSSITSLRTHTKNHTGEKPFSCEQCDCRTSTITGLRKHIKTHAGERSFECGHCDYRAPTKSSLQNHMRIHTGERSFKCGFCDYRASRKPNLLSHLRIHGVKYLH